MINLIADIDTASETRLLARLEALPRELQIALEGPISSLTAEMLARVQAAEPVRTGALRAATHSFVDIRDRMVRGRVRVLAEPDTHGNHNIKAGALEYGAHGEAHVHGYAREDETVSAYSRDVHIAEHRFLRDSMSGIHAQFVAEVEAAIAAVTKGFHE